MRKPTNQPPPPPPASPPPPPSPTTPPLERITSVLLDKIFVRCPAKDLCQLRAVNKNFGRKLTDKEFVKFYGQQSKKYAMFTSFNMCLSLPLSADQRQSQAFQRFGTPPWPLFVLGSCDGLILFHSGFELYLKNMATNEARIYSLSLFQEVYWPREIFRGTYGLGKNESGDFIAVCLGHLDAARNDGFQKQVLIGIYNFTKQIRYMLPQPYEDGMAFPRSRNAVNIGGRLLHWICGTNPGRAVRILSFDIETENFGEVGLPPGINPYYTTGRYLKLVALGNKLALFSIRRSTEPTENFLWVLEEYGDISTWRCVNMPKNITGEPVNETHAGELVFASKSEVNYYSYPDMKHITTTAIDLVSANGVHGGWSTHPNVACFVESLVSPNKS